MKRSISIFLTILLLYSTLLVATADLGATIYTFKGSLDEGGDVYTFHFGTFDSDDTGVGVTVNGKDYPLSDDQFKLAKLNGNKFGIGLSDRDNIIKEASYDVYPYAIDADSQKNPWSGNYITVAKDMAETVVTPLSNTGHPDLSSKTIVSASWFKMMFGATTKASLKPSAQLFLQFTSYSDSSANEYGIYQFDISDLDGINDNCRAILTVYAAIGAIPGGLSAQDLKLVAYELKSENYSVPVAEGYEKAVDVSLLGNKIGETAVVTSTSMAGTPDIVTLDITDYLRKKINSNADTASIAFLPSYDFEDQNSPSGVYMRTGIGGYTASPPPSISFNVTPEDVTLSDIQLDGVSIDNFNSTTDTYIVELEDSTIPTVTATASDSGLTPSISAPVDKGYGIYEVSVTVTGLYGTEKIYTIQFGTPYDYPQPALSIQKTMLMIFSTNTKAKLSTGATFDTTTLYPSSAPYYVAYQIDISELEGIRKNTKIYFNVITTYSPATEASVYLRPYKLTSEEYTEATGTEAVVANTSLLGAAFGSAQSVTATSFSTNPNYLSFDVTDYLKEKIAEGAETATLLFLPEMNWGEVTPVNMNVRISNDTHSLGGPTITYDEQ